MLSDKFIKIFKECSIVTIACIVMAFNINYFFLGNKAAPIILELPLKFEKLIVSLPL